MILPQSSSISHNVQQQKNNNLYKKACRPHLGLLFATKEELRSDAISFQIGKGHNTDIFCMTGYII